MLNNVPTQIRRSARLVTLNHPNAMDCTVWRKSIDRTPDTGSLSGLPNVGGMGLLDGEDEADYDYVEIGDAKIVYTGIYDGQGANWNDAETGLNYTMTSPAREALIECVLSPNDPNFFVVQKSDTISVEPGGGIVLPYEVLGEVGDIDIPPYTRKFIIAARSDSDVGVG